MSATLPVDSRWKSTDFCYYDGRASPGHQGQEMNHPLLKNDLEPALELLFLLLSAFVSHYCSSYRTTFPAFQLVEPPTAPKFMSLPLKNRAKTDFIP